MPASLSALINSAEVTLPFGAKYAATICFSGYAFADFTPLTPASAFSAFWPLEASLMAGERSASQALYCIEAPMKCGVAAIFSAIAWADAWPSSNSIRAVFVFQSTVAARIPLTVFSDDSTVLVHGGQWSPVTRNVAFVTGGLTVVAPVDAGTL